MKPRLLLARLCDLCHYSWKAARANRFPKILFIKKQTQWSNDKTIIFYEHYLANIALNLEVRFDSGAHFTVYLKLELQRSGA